MLGIPLGVAYSHVVEWGLHRYLLHGRGKSRDSFFAFHFHDHHAESRRQEFRDDMYEGSPWKWNAAGKELFALTGLGLAHVPLLPVAPFFTLTIFCCARRYYVLHRKAHLDPEWARDTLPWHFDHHMGPDQDKNYGVTTDWVDRLMGTRAPYLGTDREIRDTARRRTRAQATAAAQ